jgi:uncharacterized protein (DUF2132 family)
MKSFLKNKRAGTTYIHKYVYIKKREWERERLESLLIKFFKKEKRTNKQDFSQSTAENPKIKVRLLQVGGVFA